MAVPVYLVAAAFSVMNGFASDYARRRYHFCIGPLVPVIIALGILLAGKDSSVQANYAACFLLTSGNFAALSIAITWLSNNIDCRKTRGVALGLVAGLGNCGHILGSSVFSKPDAPFYVTGFAVCLAMTMLAIMAATAQLLYLLHQRRRGIDVIL